MIIDPLPHPTIIDPLPNPTIIDPLHNPTTGLPENPIPPATQVQAGPQTPREERNIATKLFGPDGGKNFRSGWKVGKKLYSVEHKCEKYKKYLQCEHASSKNCTLDEGNMSSPYCVVELVENMNNTCHENCGVPPETPCFYVDGTLVDDDGGKCTPPLHAPTQSDSPISPPIDITNSSIRIMVLETYQCLAIMILMYFLAICRLF